LAFVATAVQMTNRPTTRATRLCLAIGVGIVFFVVVLFAPYLMPGRHKDNVFGATWIGLAMALATFGVANRANRDS
jgi:peptidoglycan/LPS O-acetylase OafA/YrhL